MKHSSQTLITLLIVLAFMVSLANPLFADTRSATVRVSCTILPMLEIAMPKMELRTDGSLVHVGTNLGKDYDVSETLLTRPEGSLKLYSVTAL